MSPHQFNYNFNREYIYKLCFSSVSESCAYLYMPNVCQVLILFIRSVPMLGMYKHIMFLH